MPSLSPELAMIDACARYALTASQAVITAIKLIYADGRTYCMQLGRGQPSTLAVYQPPADGAPLTRLLSLEGVRICQAVADRAPVAIKALIDATGIERSKLYILVADLTGRGMIADRGEGLVIADERGWEASRVA